MTASESQIKNVGTAWISAYISRPSERERMHQPHLPLIIVHLLKHNNMLNDGQSFAWFVGEAQLS